MKYPFASDAYIMLPSVFYHWGEDDFPARQDVQLLTSRDGRSWDRAGDRRAFLNVGAEGSATDSQVFANPWLTRVGDELWFYYSGTARKHSGGMAPQDLAPGADKLSGIYRASMRLE